MEPSLHASLRELLPKLAAEPHYQYVLEHGEASAVVYAPQSEDRQNAHAQAEIYAVVRGRGRLLNGFRELEFATGDLLFVDIGVEHRFLDFSADLVVWAVFFGPSILGRHMFNSSANDGADRSGEMVVTQNQGTAKERGDDVLRAEWRVSAGPSLRGIGFGRDGHMAFARTADDRKKAGLVEYRLDNGQLRARWAHPDLGGRIGRGSGTDGEKHERFSGRFIIQYDDGKGHPVGRPLDLEIDGGGCLRTLKWSDSSNLQYEGIGLEVDGLLVAAWGSPGTDVELVDLASPRPGQTLLQGNWMGIRGRTPKPESVSLSGVIR
jgi:hypothetical protein